jgi:hypothetical protein
MIFNCLLCRVNVGNMNEYIEKIWVEGVLTLVL